MRFFTLFLFLGLATALSAQNINEKLVAFFPFSNCKGTDQSGNGSSGALIGDASCVCGVRDSAITFDGNGDAIFFVGPLSDVFTTSDFSVSFYFKPAKPSSNFGGWRVLMSKQENCNAPRGFSVRYNHSTKKISAVISQNDTLRATVTANLTPGYCWQYVTLVRSNTLFSVYLNGKLAGSQKSTARIDLTSNAVLKVGEPLCLLDSSYLGDIDQIRIYSKALNQDDIDALNLRSDRILTGDTVIYLGNSLQIQASSSCTNVFKWTPATGVSNDLISEPMITPTTTTTYRLDFDYQGCKAFDTIRIKVIDPDTLDCNQIFIPNAFTPSASQGRNDVFGVSNPYAVDEFISFEVFDRWGGRVFNAPSVFDAWDGTFQGEALNAGVFLYRLRYRCDGVERVKAGSLTLLR